MDEFSLLRFAHMLGLTLMGAGLIGVFTCDMRSRQTKDLKLFSQLVTLIAVFYDGVVVPGALLLLASGTWLIVQYYDGWAFLEIPWLVGMVGLFLFEICIECRKIQIYMGVQEVLIVEVLRFLQGIFLALLLCSFHLTFQSSPCPFSFFGIGI